MRFEWIIPIPPAAVAGQHGVYVIFDGADEVLYIGRTRDLPGRLRGHKSQSAWYPLMRRIEFTPCDGPNEARALEKSMIATFRPTANINDGGPQQRSVRQTLPSWTVAKLVEMHEACVEAVPHAAAENARLNNYILALRRAGWTLAALGEGLTMTREAIRLRELRATRADATAGVPAVPVKIKPAKKKRPTIPPATLALLLELKAQAVQVRGWTPPDSPLRTASERYSEMLAEQYLAGVNVNRIAIQLGVTPLAIQARLARHGYLPEVRGLPKNVRYGTAWPPPGERTECKHGHPFSGENLHLVNGRRRCRACIRRRSAEYRTRKASA